jgi:hypothetical protein
LNFSGGVFSVIHCAPETTMRGFNLAWLILFFVVGVFLYIGMSGLVFFSP